MTDPTTTSSIVGRIVNGLQAYRGFAYSDMASITIIYLEWLLNFDSEIKLIWNGEGVPMKVVYLLTRYLSVAYSLPVLLYHFGRNTASECMTLYKAESALFLCFILCVDLILTIRTWAVWAKGKCITYLLLGMYAMSLTSMVVLYVVSLKYTMPNSAMPKFSGCHLLYKSLLLPAVFIVHTAFDTAVLVLMLIRGVSLYWWGKDSGLFRTIYSDGISFYVYNAGLSLANVALLFGQSDYNMLLLPIQGAIGPALACRVVLHIRKKYDQLRTTALPTTKNGNAGTVPVKRGVIEQM